MKPIVSLLFFHQIILSQTEENVTISSTTESLNHKADDMEGRESNITLVLASLEETLPSPAPLVGTFPHDFDLTLPSVSRRSYEQGHSFEEQGADFPQL